VIDVLGSGEPVDDLNDNIDSLDGFRTQLDCIENALKEYM